MSWKAFSAEYVEKVNHKLKQNLDSQAQSSSLLSQAMQYSLFAGGKRVRPFLLIATGHTLNINTEKLIDCAAAIECIHTYSLIHDDLPAMDDDDLRRGKPTCHIQFDEATAILAGDALQTLAFEIIANSTHLNDGEKIKAISLLSSASGLSGMCGGQSIDLLQTGKSINQADLEQLHRLKTGALIDASVAIPCKFAAQNEVNTLHFQQFSRAVGLGFQVQDDILDVEGDTEQLGKPQGSDEKSAKNTYPSLMGMTEAKQYLQTLHQEALQALQSIPYNTNVLASFTEYLFNRNH